MPKIIDVWTDNLNTEIKAIRQRIKAGYKDIALDTEFPGFVMKVKNKTAPAHEYNEIKSNVNQLKLIQFGFTLTKDQEDYMTWQFNMRFDINTDQITLYQKCT